MRFLVLIWKLLFGPGTVSSQRPTTWTFPAPSSPTPGSPQPRPVELPPQTLGLDASQFAPIGSREAISIGSTSEEIRNNPWWGRLDTIPPASDLRTLLIDRTLVAYGLMTPEELVETHRIGDQMLKIRGDEGLADAEARKAVAAMRTERAERKKQKQNESAERKRLRAEEVSRRRATDIIFLGRGVSRGLADRRSNVEKLQNAGLPVISTPAELAENLGISIPRLRWLAFHSDASETMHYVRFQIPKKSGGTRELASPRKNLRTVQRWILENILNKISSHPAAHGFVKERSIRTNGVVHMGREVLVNVDLEDYFPSIHFHRVRGAFQQLGYSPAVATILGLICTESPRRTVKYTDKVFQVATGKRALPQGACTSPALSNLISRRLDSRLHGLASKLGWEYTRYADDLSFSGNRDTAEKKMTGYLLARIRHIAEEEGFAVNEKKTRVLRQNTAMLVTGVVVNREPGMRRKEVRKLRAILHNAQKTGIQGQNREGDPRFDARIRGLIAFLKMLRPAQGDALRAKFDSLES